jgi:hypothetical protein
MTIKRRPEPERKVDGVGSLLDEAEGRRNGKRPPAPSTDLDIDKAWSRD